MTAVPPPADEQAAADELQPVYKLEGNQLVPDNPELFELVEKFEHEFDLNLEKVTVSRTGFDGRLGDPALVMKRNMTRFFKHYVAAYSRTQTEAVLSDVRNWIDRNHYQPINESDRWVQASGEIMSHIDTEIARLRGEAGTQIIPTPSTSLSGTTEHLTEQNTKHSIRICREGKEIWKMPDTTTDGEMK